MQFKAKEFFIKFSVFPVLFSTMDFGWAVSLSLLLLVFYRDVIGLAYKLQPFPSMDICTFFSTPNANSNIMSVIYFERLATEKTKEKFRELIEKLPKMRTSIVEILGDYYYK